MTTLKGVFPDPKPVRRKNFIQENVKNLRRMEQCFHTNKEVEELHRLQLHGNKPLNKYQNVTARVNTSFREKKPDDSMVNASINKKEESAHEQPYQKNSAPALNKKSAVLNKKTIRPFINNNVLVKQKQKNEHKQTNGFQHTLKKKNPSDPNLVHKENVHLVNDTAIQDIPKYKHRGIQTLDEKNIDNLYYEGVIRYPTKGLIKQDEVTNIGELECKMDKLLNGQLSPPSDRGDICITGNEQSALKNEESSHEEIDFIKLNKERSIATKFAAQLNNGSPPTNYRKGVVPKYLRERKEALQKEQKAKAETSHSDCPEGHVPVPDHERKETLQMLKKNYQDYVNELNMMPIRTDTLRAQKKKMEIEKQLTKLEEAIKVFSRPKVYVKINA